MKLISISRVRENDEITGFATFAAFALKKDITAKDAKFYAKFAENLQDSPP